MGFIRFLTRTVVGFILLAILAVVLAYFFGSGVASSYLSSKLTAKLGVPVEISSIRPTLSSIQIGSITLGNLGGGMLPKSFSAESTSINAPLMNYFNQHVEIDSIEINDVYIGLEFDSPKGTQGNWTIIMSNANRSHTAAQQAGDKKSKKSVMIHTLALNRIKTDLLFRSDGKVRHLKDIDRIELHDISSEGGDLSEQLMNSALGEMVKQVFTQQNMNDLLEKILQPGDNNPIPGILRGIFSSADESKT